MRPLLRSQWTGILLLPSLALAQKVEISDLVRDLTQVATARQAKKIITERGERGVLELVHELQRMPTTEVYLPRRRAALEFLASIPEIATGAVPHLLKSIQATSDTDGLHAYFLALQEIAPYYHDKNQVHAVAVKHVPMLLRSEDGEWVTDASDMRIIAGLRTLARIEIDPEASLHTLGIELGHKNPLRREYAAILIGRRGRAARPALTDLLQTFEAKQPTHINGPGFRFEINSDRLVQRAIAVAISRIDPSHPDAVAGLMIRLKRGTASDRISAALTLGQIGQTVRAVDALMVSCLDTDPRIAGESISALGTLGPKARRATGLLQKIARGEDKQQKLRAKAALAQILKPAKLPGK